MRDVMCRRGPDDAGFHASPGVALAHRRLSIIDLSPAGHQPMSNEDGSVWIVFNGEIYNFQDLRPELAPRHVFRSHSDTETLVHGYEEWGLDGLAGRLRGMFAAAIWDGRRRQLHLLRDPVGKKPLFYRAVEGRVSFASDIKALWLESGGRLELDERALDEYLYYYCISQDRAIWRGVSKLPPAHCATFDAAGASIRRYWRPDYSRKERRSTDEWLEGVDHHVRQAVRRRLISDVPLGAFLSGGVDSSAVCAVMAKESPARRIRTFSVGFRDVPSYDEREFSRAVARRIGSEHTELVLEPDIASILSSLVWEYGEPFGDSSAIPTYLISRAAREHVTVVLTGDGGDEAFAGYDTFSRDMWYADLERRVPAWIRRRAVPAAVRALLRLDPAGLFANRAELFAANLSGETRAMSMRLFWYDGLRRQLYTDSWRGRLGGWTALAARGPLLASLSGATRVDRRLEHDILTNLPNDYLTKVDVATMAASLEARCPFLDVDLLEFCSRIPADVLVASRQAKALLKQYAATLVPREVIYRPKWGFGIPVGHWFRGDWAGPLRRLLLSPQAVGRGMFDPRVVRRVLDEHAAGRFNRRDAIWQLVVLEIWMRLFVDGTLKPGDPVFDL
jgi:asparagine synthase (glutamine-hydrolysing)